MTLPVDYGTYIEILNHLKSEGFDNLREAEIEVKKILASHGYKGDKLEEVAEKILRETYSKDKSRRKELVKSRSVIQNVAQKFKISRGDTNAIDTIIDDVWIGVQSGVLKEDIRSSLYRHQLGYYLNKYPGIFDYIYDLLTATEPAGVVEKKALAQENFGILRVRAFWKYKSEKATPDPRKEIDADVFIKSSVRIPQLDSRFELTERGYNIGRTPVEIALPADGYTIVCEYEGTGRFEQRIQQATVNVGTSRRGTTQNFYFEVIETGGQLPQPLDINVRGDIGVDVRGALDVNVEGGGGQPQPPEEPEDDKMLRLVVRSTPCKGVHFIADVASHYVTDHGVPVYTNTQHTVVIDATHTDAHGRQYRFVRWDDGVTTNNRTVYVGRNDETITAQYEEEQPPPTPPPQPVPREPNCEVIVDSSPMREVHIKVEAKAEVNPITAADLQHELGGPNPRIPAILTIIADFIGRHITDEAKQLEYLNERLSLIGIRNPQALSRFIIRRATSAWQTLDDIRNDAINAAPRRAVPFELKRPPQYLAIKRQSDEMTSRFQGAGGLLQGSADLNLAGLANNVVDRNTYTYFELTLPAGRYRFTAEEKAYIGSHPGNERGGEAGAEFRYWEITTWRMEDRNWIRGGRQAVNANNIMIHDIRMTAGRAATDSRYVRSIREGTVTWWDRTLEIEINQPTKLVAFYHQAGEEGKVGAGEREQEKRKLGLNTYQRGGANAPPTSTLGHLGGMGDWLGRSGIRNRIGRNVEPKKDLGKDPFKLAAINKGKRILNRYAKAEYTREFAPRQRRFRQRAQELRRQGRAALLARTNLQRLIALEWRRSRRLAGVGLFNKSDNDMLNAAEALYAADSGISGTARAAALQQAHDTLQNYLQAKEKFNDDFSKEMESAAAHLKSVLQDKAVSTSITIARQYSMPVNSMDEGELRDALVAYSGILAENFAARGRTWSHALMRGLGIMAGGAETFSAFGMNVLQNTFDFIFGPWTWTTLFALVMFFFTLSFVGYNVTYLWIFPMIGAGFTFLLNFSDSFRPLDWVTHLSSGAIIGYSSMLLLVALGALNWSFMSTFMFWIIWAILGFLGVMQFYQTGGWKTVLQGAVIILLFAYVALGPYSAYYQQALGQIKAPVEIAYRAVSNAVTDIWLLATNPTEWYARQQLVNVRPEKPIDFPKGLEVTLLDALPPSVPAGREFALTTVIKNEGSMKQPALDAYLSFGCNQWCDVPDPDPSLAQSLYSLCHDKNLLSDEFYCGASCGRDAPDPRDPIDRPLDECISKCADKEKVPSTLSPTSVTVYRNNCLTENKQEFMQKFGYVHKLDRGEAKTVSVRGFTAVGESGRQGEVRLAEVTMNLTYRYSTSTSLQTEVMTDSEINRKIQNNENVFRNVLAVTKSSPAQLSLNVGPQPLTAGQKSLLLVSVSNTRDDSSVVLKRGMKIIITMPKVVGTGLTCEGVVAKDDAKRENEVLEYTVPQEITVLPYEFQSIFAFICEFNAADAAAVVDVKSALITAEMPDYTFVLTKKKQVPVTPPLGIQFDPYEPVCAGCGTQDITGPVSAIASTFDKCSPGECHGMKDPTRKGTCYYEYAGTGGTYTSYVNPQALFGSPCHSCGRDPSCDKFITENSCELESDLCSLTCYWDENARRPSMIEVNKKIQESGLDPNEGMCKELPKAAADVGTTPPVTTGRLTSCPGLGANERTFLSGYNLYEPQIVSAANVIRGKVAAPEAIIAAIISQESGWKADAKSPCGSVGIAQFIPSTARAYGLSVPTYSLVECKPPSNPDICGKKKRVSECNSCFPTACSAGDERLDASKSIAALANHLSDLIDQCGSLERAVNKYNSGRCNWESNAGYRTMVLDYYSKWRGCL